ADYLDWDANANGIADSWELSYFAQLGVNLNSDPDQDGMSNLEEYQLGTNPSVGNPPAVMIQPHNLTNYPGSNVTFSVTMSGTVITNYSFQWRFNATNLPGRTSASLTLTNIQSANLGNYSVIITNLYGMVI